MSGGNRSQKAQVKLRCGVCGDEEFIWRRKSKLKERFHVKHLWCPVCKERTPHIEIREDS